MNTQYLNLSALIALVGAGACLLGEISNPTAAPAIQPPPGATATATAAAATAPKTEAACPACRPKATAAMPNACPYVAAQSAEKSGCGNCVESTKAATRTP